VLTVWSRLNHRPLFQFDDEGRALIQTVSPRQKYVTPPCRERHEKLDEDVRSEKRFVPGD